ncbi:MAG: 23S rRNA (guanosine(2251)-2'-O)-methyltransferase RlmB [Sulfurovum sp. 28-43-6]|nr:MAG: 23S rRNA (guanosine(2251)-2'-O)-methyltransferase RlmB [Sulfurovum sp. 28-43-6]
MPKAHSEDTPEYLAKKAFFDKVLTIYGRNAVMEALADDTVTLHKLHLSKSNKDADVLEQMKSLALEHFGDATTFMQAHPTYRIIALDGVTNPQNLGMIIRSCAAGNIDAILLPAKGAAQISPLVIKASVGTLFKMPIIKTTNLKETLQTFQKEGATLYSLSSHAKHSYKTQSYTNKSIFVLGNESEGVSQPIETLCDKSIAIPMQRGVESLNVAVTASLLAFL